MRPQNWDQCWKCHIQWKMASSATGRTWFRCMTTHLVRQNWTLTHLIASFCSLNRRWTRQKIARRWLRFAYATSILIFDLSCGVQLVQKCHKVDVFSLFLLFLNFILWFRFIFQNFLLAAFLDTVSCQLLTAVNLWCKVIFLIIWFALCNYVSFYMYFNCAWYLLQVMFEKYQFHGLYIAIQAVLTLYAQGNIIRFL